MMPSRRKLLSAWGLGLACCWLLSAAPKAHGQAARVTGGSSSGSFGGAGGFGGGSAAGSSFGGGSFGGGSFGGGSGPGFGSSGSGFGTGAMTGNYAAQS